MTAAEALADIPVLAATAAGALWLGPDGVPEPVSAGDAARRAAASPPLLVHGVATARRLGIEGFAAYDLLELYAFVRPAMFALPTPAGLVRAVDAGRPDTTAEAMPMLREAAARLLGELATVGHREGHRAAAIALTMGRAGWPWGEPVLAALSTFEGGGRFGGLDIWNALEEWADFAPPPPPDDQPVSEAETRERLSELLGGGSESRPAQADYAAAASWAFTPRDQAGEPRMVLAEAGTGIGKTLGYIAPASLWSEKNGGTVWLSTYTRNLQRQIDGEFDRLYPDPAKKARKVVVRKGRENYFCILNFEEAVQGGAARTGERVALGLMARWAGATRDGDMGGDFPAWLIELFGRARTIGLTDRRGECVYAACPHYRRCFIERSQRKARRADTVIANHALVMLHAATRGDDREMPSRYVFDEGHHLFDAADSAFSAHLGGQEGNDLRRWIRGPEGSRRSRARGITRRIGDLVIDRATAAEALSRAVEAAAILPGEGWQTRLKDGNEMGPAEAFLGLVRRQVYARARGADGPYAIECGTAEPVPGLIEAARTLAQALDDILSPLKALAGDLAALIEDETAEIDSGTRVRLEAAAQGIRRRTEHQLAPWIEMLNGLSAATPPAFVDWFAVDRIGGQDSDVGFHRHWIDPTKPFAEAVLKRAHGVVVTSATLGDRGVGSDDDWHAAEVRTGALHITLPAKRVSIASPFDYAERTRVFVVNDVRRDNVGQVSAAFRDLFIAANGGALGLFTAIWRLRAVYERMAPALNAHGIPLYAQHVDAMDTGTLVDIFRAERDSCLLGTDAVRDGVDVPGQALRLLVFDRVPWPRPDILHRARKAAFGGSAYDDMLTRLRIKQAFGRLLRRGDDYGVFVMLDAMLPTRLLSALPPGVPVARVGIAEAVAETRAMLDRFGEKPVSAAK
ncbi:ATP-dependent DNA helicase [Oceanibacterium hippocampi]|uniref:Bifunctional ATP-dependent DNA helicase/DNA polymerase III subunit epsilon n=1 Tax=Oceanibacterium hippocampi TaxID=745714 RepID=A0A1Y5RAR7_9PROT|nr:ATP-dependent DNA helicase [Oceanibacterium hippocampi]SLN11940.1 bifunctional ATP-dependent DNA helicase/DNA polymerase III subunit epsilon [Oceanibacterium hippocampi]